MSEGIRVAAVDDIPEGEGIVIARSITGTDDDVALRRDDDGSVWALDNTCTHAEASLAERVGRGRSGRVPTALQ
jgi:3-phenylpropionate/trans-cinnamate dioxygenase ferredoxin component